jgi:hypothetical protein
MATGGTGSGSETRSRAGFPGCWGGPVVPEAAWRRRSAKLRLPGRNLVAARSDLS